jgi:hypothetical protein
MQLKSVPWWLWFTPIAFLLVATAQMSLGYYAVTRIIVFGFSAFVTIMSWSGSPLERWGSVALVMVAVAFNPFMPLPFTREIWVVLDWVCMAVFVAHLTFVRLRSLKTSAD